MHGSPWRPSSVRATRWVLTRRQHWPVSSSARLCPGPVIVHLAPAPRPLPGSGLCCPVRSPRTLGGPDPPLAQVPPRVQPAPPSHSRPFPALALPGGGGQECWGVPRWMDALGAPIPPRVPGATETGLFTRFPHKRLLSRRVPRAHRAFRDGPRSRFTGSWQHENAPRPAGCPQGAARARPWAPLWH